MLLSLSLLLSIVVFTAPAAAIPPPTEQIAANCLAPVYASDRLVCEDPRLRGMDERLRTLWPDIAAAVDEAAATAPDPGLETQAAWFARRSLCAFTEQHAACLQGAYLERIAVLDSLRTLELPPRRPADTAVCAGSAGGQDLSRVVMRWPAPGALVIGNDQGRVLAVATPASPEGSWVPHLGFVVDGTGIRLARRDGTLLHCRFAEPR